MEIAKVTALLSSLRVQEHGISSEVSTKNGIACLRFSLESDSDDFAIVTTPGITWYELAVRGGFATVHIDEDASDAEVTEVIRAYAKAAVAYMRGQKSIIRSRVLRVPAILVDTDDGPVDLRLSLSGAVKAIFRPGSKRNTDRS